MDTSPLLLELGGGAVGGYLLARGFKKLTKLILDVIAAVTAILFAFLALLDHYGYITVNWQKIGADLQTSLASLLQTVVSSTPQTLTLLQSYLTTYLPVGGAGIATFWYTLTHRKT